ncbi:UDP-N-acetylmuramoyl-tripeptide--D-alanyl-D-alanine ligase [Salinicola sp. MH3R3-1]|uniref:UDP-N-acetylmuramoyl-tripeptide--D-alanyl-D- alanine ligase n=1 Tax=Salinicola sp. MH3R3-1 TaxID=1928762 RepID=UPI00094F0DC2|nr:UDP-N-acetylmuramoyl-tripeptide--D-alanyl-D-alanine ligase [Salinicola sp. MH3R3-1]OLO07118.1 UDP-N-acetylmuramoyl-tripeptide--D-alanyl-D-alanine ligase [Salinicola sp. MH3R3-1]
MNGRLSTIAAQLGATLRGADVEFSRVVTDTRALLPGDLLVALEGERFDAHDFLSQAREKGAVGAIVSRPIDDSLTQIEVPDTRLALGLLARAHRLAWDGQLIAVTGNSGKTTVKEMLASILPARAPTLATRGNQNNDIGAPLTLLELSAEQRYAAIELGANHLGEISWTTALAKPQVAIITNVTGAHVGEFGGLGQIAQAKGEILAGLPVDGCAVLDRDERYFPVWQALAGRARVIDFGIDTGASVVADDLVCDAAGRYAFTLHLPGETPVRVTLSLMGRHNVRNALAAAAATHALGFCGAEIAAGLEACHSMAGRMQALDGIRGSRVIDDSYNANPGAMRAALEVLASLPSPRWCFLGAMGEMGADAERLHAEVGRAARDLGIEFLGTYGEPARAAIEAFGDEGRHFNDWATLERFAQDQLPSRASVLVKGSRSAGMERLVAALRDDASR